MTVQVIHRLPAVGLAINNKARSLFSAALLFCKFLGSEKQLSKQRSVIQRSIHNIFYVLFWYYKEMHRRLGVYVAKGDKFVILEQLLGRYFPFDYFTKYAVAHAARITNKRNSKKTFGSMDWI